MPTKSEPPRKDGWSYLTPGDVHRAALIRSAVTVLTMVVAAVLAPRFWPSESRAVLVGSCLVIAGAFGATGIAVYMAAFRNKVRWNEEHLEKITVRRTTRIAWTEVTNFGFRRGLDPSFVTFTGQAALLSAVLGPGLFLVASDRSRVKISPHLNGVWDLWIKLGGREGKLKLKGPSGP